MTLPTGKEYKESIRALRLECHIMGECQENLPEGPMLGPSIESVAATFEGAHAPEQEVRNLYRAQSHLTGSEVSRFCHLHQSADDLVKKIMVQRHCGRVTGCCFQRCVGWDAANSVFSVTHEVDAEHGTNYHKRFCDYWRQIQLEGKVVDGAMTDPKGDRGKRPSEQPDPDVYVHVVDRKPGGVVVRGAKLHQTGMLNSHEILVMPTLRMREGEEDFAIAFAIPTTEKGIRYILGRQSCDTRKLEGSSLDVGNPTYGTHEVLAIFEDVFVPEERIFLNGELSHSGELVERFAAYHRQSYGGCKVGVGDMLIGATALIAQMNGVAKASHIRDKIVEMIHLNETIYSCGIACSALGHRTKAGNYEIDRLLANVCKQNVTRFPYEIARLATDIAGGLIATLPSDKDLQDPVAGPYIKKYLAGAEGVDTVDRMKVLRLIENMVVGTGAVAYLIESVHGAGPPMAQRIMIARQADLEAKIDRVKKLLNIS